MKVGIIGSGIGGLAAAIRLSAKGHKVHVYEKNDRPGGKMSEINMGGFRFDTGPSLFTLPKLIEDLYKLSGVEVNFPYKRLEISCRYFFCDGSVFNFYDDKDLLKEEIENKTCEISDNIFKRLEHSKEAYELGAPVFIFNSFHKLSNFRSTEYQHIALQLHKLDFMRTMHKANKKDFKDKRFTQIFDRYATYNGSNPYRAPATLNMIAHLENNLGSYFPEKGMYSIIRALYDLALNNGVTFHFDTLVEEVMTKNDKVWGLMTSLGVQECDVVVSDCDVKYLANNLFKNYPLRRRMNKMERSSSALIFYWGVKGTYPSLDVHNILFTKNYSKEFDCLFGHKRIYVDPTIYIFISSKVVKNDAPDGCENWFVMVNAPSDTDLDWEKFIYSTRKNILYKISKYLNIELRDRIVCESVCSPLDIENRTLSMDGALYGTSSNSMFSAFLRHPNFIRKIKNMYFTGGSVHPGGGIPLCLASAKIVDDEIFSRFNK